MIRIGWSYPDLMACPAAYLPLLVKEINEADKRAAGK